MPSISRCLFVSIPFLLTVGTLLGLTLTWSGNVSKNNVAQSFWFFGVDTSAAQYAGTSVANTTIQHNLAGWYTVGLWNYCSGSPTSTDPTFCSKPTFGYFFNPITEFGLSSEILEHVPQKYLNSISSLHHVSRWSSIAYLIAILSAALTLPISILAFHRRLGSLLAAIISAATAAFAILASAAATVMYATLAAVIKEGSGGVHNLAPVINAHALGATWYASASATLAFFFWLFTACCCRGRVGGNEVTPLSARRDQYQRVGGYHGPMEMGYDAGYVKQEHLGAARFEPYRH